jgi:hypothetical protein
MPGPTEPTTEQMNNAFQSIVKELRQLKQVSFEVDLFRRIQLLILLMTQGVKMKIHSQEPAKVYADCQPCTNSMELWVIHTISIHVPIAMQQLLMWTRCQVMMEARQSFQSQQPLCTDYILSHT